MNKHEVTQCVYFTGVEYVLCDQEATGRKEPISVVFLSRRGKTEKIYKIWR